MIYIAIRVVWTTAGNTGAMAGVVAGCGQSKIVCSSISRIVLPVLTALGVYLLVFTFFVSIQSSSFFLPTRLSLGFKLALPADFTSKDCL